ncbi:MAG: L,D-transpeptidase [Actinomycetota bacterium]|nr:L,D-transpeptidase [Actinomycetota bacterium]
MKRSWRMGIAAAAVASMTLSATPLSADAWRASPSWGGRSVEKSVQSGVTRAPPVVEAPQAAPERPQTWRPALGVRPTGDAVQIHARPRHRSEVVHTLPTLTAFQQVLVFRVLRVVDRPATGRWYRVLIPERPNDSTGWIHHGAVDEVALRDRIVVDLSRRTLRHFRDGELQHRFWVGIGRDGTPTPTGEFFVWATVPYPNGGPYGVHALGLSAFSDVITDWAGGGRVAIHGTADPSNRGHQVSNGCVRVYNPQMAKLTDVPLGTPVTIRA